MDTINTFICI